MLIFLLYLFICLFIYLRIYFLYIFSSEMNLLLVKVKVNTIVFIGKHETVKIISQSPPRHARLSHTLLYGKTAARRLHINKVNKKRADFIFKTS